MPPHPLIFYTSRLIGPLIAVLLLQLGGAACFVAVEGWDYGTAVYHCMITATVRATSRRPPAARRRDAPVWAMPVLPSDCGAFSSLSVASRAAA